MSVHACMVFLPLETDEQTAVENLHTRVDDMLGAFEGEARNKNFKGNVVEDFGGNKYLKSVYRFQLSEEKDQIIQAIKDKIEEDGLGWYRIMYHECLNDSDNPDTACTNPWETVEENNVPDWL